MTGKNKKEFTNLEKIMKLSEDSDIKIYQLINNDIIIEIKNKAKSFNIIIRESANIGNFYRYRVHTSAYRTNKEKSLPLNDYLMFLPFSKNIKDELEKIDELTFNAEAYSSKDFIFTFDYKIDVFLEDFNNSAERFRLVFGENFINKNIIMNAFTMMSLKEINDLFNQYFNGILTKEDLISLIEINSSY